LAGQISQVVYKNVGVFSNNTDVSPFSKVYNEKILMQCDITAVFEHDDYFPTTETGFAD
jgi:hypothetical protein